jgi:hypothetical protein
VTGPSGAPGSVAGSSKSVCKSTIVCREELVGTIDEVISEQQPDVMLAVVRDVNCGGLKLCAPFGKSAAPPRLEASRGVTGVSAGRNDRWYRHTLGANTGEVASSEVRQTSSWAEWGYIVSFARPVDQCALSTYWPESYNTGTPSTYPVFTDAAGTVRSRKQVFVLLWPIEWPALPSPSNPYDFFVQAAGPRRGDFNIIATCP